MKTIKLSQAYSHLGEVEADVFDDPVSSNPEIREAYAGRVSLSISTGGANIRVSPTIAEARALAAAILAAAGAVEATL